MAEKEGPTKMEIGISIYSGIEIESIVKSLKEHGVKRTFLRSEMEDFDNVMSLLNESEIICETLHAPYDTINDMWCKDEEKGNAVLTRLKNAVDRCVKYEIPIVVVHVSSGRPMPVITEEGIRRYQWLFEYAEERGIQIALENLRFFENLDYFFDNYDFPRFCWDNGHEVCFTPGADCLKKYKDRMIALHINDNRCDYDADDHIIPLEGNIDFDNVAKRLAQSGYDGTLMLEIAKDIVVSNFSCLCWMGVRLFGTR